MRTALTQIWAVPSFQQLCLKIWCMECKKSVFCKARAVIQQSLSPQSHIRIYQPWLCFNSASQFISSEFLESWVLIFVKLFSVMVMNDVTPTHTESSILISSPLFLLAQNNSLISFSLVISRYLMGFAASWFSLKIRNAQKIRCFPRYYGIRQTGCKKYPDN